MGKTTNMNKYFIPADIILTRGNYSEKNNLLSIYNKNANRWYNFKNAVKCDTKYGWIAERHNLPSYFSKVIKSFNHLI